jgi:signal peptidase I
VEWVVIIVAALLVALVVKTFLVQAFYIPSGSMEPTLEPGDRVLVNKISYDLHSVHRGDIVVFAKPASDYDPGVSDLVKRVIGLPGETIASGPDGQILIDGKPIPQPWLTQSAKVSPGPAIVASDCGTPSATSCVIPHGDYFMMGDNRGDSADSRVIGPIPGHLIVGKVFTRVWPLDRIHWF